MNDEWKTDVNGIHINGIPYVSGCAQGKLQRHCAEASVDDILIVSHANLSILSNFRPAGLIIVDGAPFSHPLIQMLGLELPIAIISSHDAKQLPDGIYVQLNGTTGEIKQITTTEVIDDITSGCKTPVIPNCGQPLATADGVEVALRASVSTIPAVANAIAHGACSIGLVRSEFLQPPHAQVPDTTFFIEAFTKLCETASPLSVTIRLLDMAPDKQPAWLPPQPGMRGPLGLQGARLYDTKLIQGVWHAQVAAMGQLDSHYDLRVLIPYITTLNEYRHWRYTIQQLIDDAIPVGAMAETPAALLNLGDWLKYADFVAIGTNDLMQYLFAADRDLPELRGYLNPYSPVLFRFLQHAISNAGPNTHRIQVSGLLSQLPGIMSVLLGMGYRTFSVEPHKIPYLAQTVKQTRLAQARELAEQVCAADNSATVCRLLDVPLVPLWLEG